MTLPTGTVTFLFTDIEGSTRLMERHGAAYGAALKRHHAILEDAGLTRPRCEHLHSGCVIPCTGLPCLAVVL